MAEDFFHPDMELFVDHRVDWRRYLRLRRGDEGNANEEIATYKMILRTLADICQDIEAEARDCWHEEVRLESGTVVVPAHLRERTRSSVARGSCA